MRLMFSYKGINKVMLSANSFDQVVKYVHENFYLKMSKWTMSYIDMDGDFISIDSESDYETMVETAGRNHMKIYIKDVESSQSGNVQPSIQENSEQLQKSDSPVFIVASTQEKKEQIKIQNSKEEISEKLQNVSEPIVQAENKKQSENYGECYMKNPHRQAWKKKMQQKMAKFVDQRLQSLIPLIAKKVGQNLQIPQKKVQVAKQVNNVQHKVKCTLCEVEPIIGIRYKCTKCPMFNLCSMCQSKQQHKHNLIKMKYIQVEEVKQQYPWWKHRQEMKNPFGWKMPPPFAHGNGHHMPPHFGPPGCGPLNSMGFTLTQQKQGPSSSPVAGFCIPNKKQEETNDDSRLKITKKCFRLSKNFGGQPSKYEQFVTKNLNLTFDELTSLYTTMNDNIIISSELNQKIDQKSLKLGFYFQKPSQMFKQLVKQHPTSNLKQLIKKVNQQNIVNVSSIKKDQKKQKEVEKQSYKPTKIEMIQVKTEKPEPVSISKVVVPIVPPLAPKKSELSVKKRNQFVIQMKDLFGQDKLMDYIKFFNENFQKQNEDIISMYIQKITKM